jgi:hypothetical protein
MVLSVVPGEEPAAVRPGILDRAKPLGTTFRLLSRVDRRRVAFATTLISGPRGLAPPRSSASYPDPPSTLNSRGSLSHSYWQGGRCHLMAMTVSPPA